jgi:hypothetical protein
VDLGAIISELKRRRVFRVLIGYGVVAFTLLQIVEPVQHALGLSDAVLKAVVVLLGFGFPVSLILAWAFDINAGRIERTPGGKSGRVALILVAAGLLIAAPACSGSCTRRRSGKGRRRPRRRRSRCCRWST